jgi:serine protease AprX
MGLTINETKKLVQLDQQEMTSEKRAIYRMWPDFSMKLLIDKSVTTIKADAGRRSYDATGNDIVWAVIDSGIQGIHPHFKPYDTLGGSLGKLHRDDKVWTNQYRARPDDQRSRERCPRDYGRCHSSR